MASTSVEGRRLMTLRKATPTTTGTPQTPLGRLKLRSRITVLGLGLIAGLAVFVTEANAQICPPGHRYIGGTCISTGSVRIEAEVNNTGDLKKTPKSFHGSIQTILPAGGMLYCGNKGDNQPQEQKIVPIPASLQCDGPVKKVDSQENYGTASVECLAQANLRRLDQFCTPGQVAFAFVPCEFQSVVTYTDKSKKLPVVIEKACHRCTLSSCNTLGWDKQNGRPERRFYDSCEGPFVVP
jgi:hypothetical protein